MQHQGASGENGFGDLSATLKYRFLSANEQNGNYIVTGLLGVSLPTGEPPNGGQALTVMPTIAVGKGFKSFDVQSTLSMQFPVDRIERIGRTLSWNTAFQYYLPYDLWPEIEVNLSHFVGGPHANRTQALITPGLVLGKFVIHHRLGIVVGAGYQVAVTEFRTDDNAVIATARMPF